MRESGSLGLNMLPLHVVTSVQFLNLPTAPLYTIFKEKKIKLNEMSLWTYNHLFSLSNILVWAINHRATQWMKIPSCTSNTRQWYLLVSFARAIVKHCLFCVSYLIFSSNYQEEKDEQGRAKKCKLDSKLLNPSEMIVLFCCHANRHVRNPIIYSIIPVPGYYYNKFFSSFLSLCSHIQSLVF